jgi:hypothetical protein
MSDVTSNVHVSSDTCESSTRSRGRLALRRTTSTEGIAAWSKSEHTGALVGCHETPLSTHAPAIPALRNFLHCAGSHRPHLDLSATVRAATVAPRKNNARRMTFDAACDEERSVSSVSSKVADWP